MMSNRPTDVFRTRAALNRLKTEFAKTPACSGRVDKLKPQHKLFKDLTGVGRGVIEDAWAGKKKWVGKDNYGFQKETLRKFEEVVGADLLVASLRPGPEKDLLDAFDFARALACRGPLPIDYQDILLEREAIYERWSPDALIDADDERVSAQAFRGLLKQLYERSYHLRMLHYMYFLINWLEPDSVSGWCRDIAVLAVIEWGRSERDRAILLERWGATRFERECYLHGDGKLRESLLHALEHMLFREWTPVPNAGCMLTDHYVALCEPREGTSGLQQIVATNDVGKAMNLTADKGLRGCTQKLRAARLSFRHQLSEFGMGFLDVNSLLDGCLWLHPHPMRRTDLAGQLWDREVSIV